MKYIFELNHPKHFYQFRIIIKELESQNHKVIILAREKDVLLNILNEEKVDFIILGKHKKHIVYKILNYAFSGK